MMITNDNNNFDQESKKNKRVFDLSNDGKDLMKEIIEREYLL